MDAQNANLPTYSSANDVIAACDKLARRFRTGETKSIEFRRQQLMKLKRNLIDKTDIILHALYNDLGKDPYEGFVTEVGLVLDEIDLALKHLRCWARPQCKRTPLMLFPARSHVYPQPYGVACIMSPWNYPFQLTMTPLVDAIAAGNCVAVKPSSVSVHTSQIMLEIIADTFDSDYVCGFPGSKDMDAWIAEPAFDIIFFTGSPRVGHTIMANAAKHLTPVVLELGGKSPCIVDATANIKRAGQRIAWGKGINTGQTCVAPDYLLVHEDVVEELIQELDRHFHQYYGENILACSQWPHMISQNHFDRVMGLIKNVNPNAKVRFGGNGDPSTLKIEPTLITGVTLDDQIMQEEIFGPVLPVLTWSTLEEAYEIIEQIPTPLATYVFSTDRTTQDRIINDLPFGGGCINDVVVHEATNLMGFGGLGNSGMGRYHGKAGFDTFTHYKSVIRRGNLIDPSVRYAPYTPEKMALAKIIM